MLKLQATLLLTLVASFVVVLNAHSLDEVNIRVSGYHNISGNSYYIVDDYALTWDDSFALCHSLDMKIVSLRSEKKNLDILQYITDNGFFDIKEYYWTSGCIISNTWLWTANGHVIEYFDWKSFEPNQLASHPCIAMSPEGWADVLQYGTYGVICE